MQEQRRFRQTEEEADRIGLVNLKRVDPRAMPSMFERLMR
jgi:predicted Zn-dependent protease